MCLTKFLQYFLIFTLLATVHFSAAQSKMKEITLETSIFVTDVFNINFPNNDVNIEFYIWFKFAKKGFENFSPLENLRILNAKESNFFQITQKTEGDSIYQLIFCKAVIKKNWTITDYPFDEHTIRVFLEVFPKQYISKYKPVVQGELKDAKLHIPGWEIDDLRYQLYAKQWNTNFGDPQLKNLKRTTTDFLQITMKISRPSGGSFLFFKTFTAVLVSVSIAFVALSLSPSDLEVRSNFTVGSLFSAVGSQFLVSSNLPETSEANLIDNVHAIAYLFIALTIFVIIITGRLCEKNKNKLAKKINYFSLIFLPSVFILILFLLWWHYFAASFAAEPSF